MDQRHDHRAPTDPGLIYALRHPVATGAFVAGIVRGVAAAVLRAASGAGGPAHAEWIPGPEPLTEEAAAPADDEIEERPATG